MYMFVEEIHSYTGAVVFLFIQLSLTGGPHQGQGDTPHPLNLSCVQRQPPKVS